MNRDIEFDTFIMAFLSNSACPEVKECINKYIESRTVDILNTFDINEFGKVECNDIKYLTPIDESHIWELKQLLKDL